MGSISTIFLDEKVYDSYTFINKSNSKYLTIKNLSKINLLVGANNSGKSRFMRMLFSQKSINFHLDYINLITYNEFITELKNKIRQVINHNNISDYGNILEKLEEIKEIEFLTEGEPNYEGLEEILNSLKNINGILQTTLNYGRNISEEIYMEINKKLQKIGDEYSKKFRIILRDHHTKSFTKIYIPTLRGLRPLEKDTDFYYTRTKNDYFNNLDLENNKNIKIFTGLNMYEEVKDLLLGSFDERNQIKEYQEFLSENFFDNNPVLLIPSKRSDVLHVKIGDEAERPIHSLGDGIQSIIIMTFQAFYYNNNRCLFFIEEPEIYLHPGLQRKLIKALSSFSNCQFFLTTHSNHLLDLSLELEIKDMSIYKFNKIIDGYENEAEITPKFEVENVSNGDTSLLDLLGVKDSSVYLANCTIWVEGITDRFYLRHYLNLYMEYLRNKESDEFINLKEDINYSFVEYGGNNITHWSFLDDYNKDSIESEVYRNINVEGICRRLFLITDKDSEKKQERQEKLRENLRDNYYCLEVKEIENLISVIVLKEVIKDYEKVATVDNLNFKTNFTEKTYANRYLGTFIEGKLNNASRTYASQSGTIKDKLVFCKKVIEHTRNISDMSLEALKLCEKVYNFILKNNK